MSISKDLKALFPTPKVVATGNQTLIWISKPQKSGCRDQLQRKLELLGIDVPFKYVPYD